LILAFVLFINANGQKEHLYELENKIEKGDKEALFEIGKYFDSGKVKVIISHARCGSGETNEASIARWIVLENCLFTGNEIKITDTTTTKQFEDFLDSNREKIVFSNLASVFIITPLEAREATILKREISLEKRKYLDSIYKEIIVEGWVKDLSINKFIESKNPVSLLLIASAYFKNRSGNLFYANDCLDLLEYLLGVEIAVKNEYNEFDWHIEKDYYYDSKHNLLNLLIYFSKHYLEYRWNEKQSCFTKLNDNIIKITNENILFEFLNNKNDSLAKDAFVKLTTSNPTKVIELANEYERARIDRNYSLPYNPYSVLRQLVVLTNYYRNNHINFTCPEYLKENIKLLDSNLTFIERYQLENKIINLLNLDNVSAFEYWVSVHREYEAYRAYKRNSVWRILNIFYSRNWKELLKNKKQLECYLYKSKLFNPLGIEYLQKFEKSSPSTKKIMNKYEGTVYNIKDQLNKIDSLDSINKTKQTVFQKSLVENKDIINDSVEKEFWYNYKITTDTSTTIFVQYKSYLENAGLDYKNSDGTLDYDKIYEILKYDEVSLLLGGGGWEECQDEVKSIAKLLEMKYHTTLGFPKIFIDRFGESHEMYFGMTDAWMKYLEDHKLLKYKHDEPRSFKEVW